MAVRKRSHLLRDSQCCRAPVDDPAHLHMFTKESLAYVIERAGGEVVDIGYTGFGCESDYFNSERQNIYALFKRRKFAEVLTTSKPDGKRIRREIRIGHRKLQLAIVTNLADKARRFLAKLLKRVVA